MTISRLGTLADFFDLLATFFPGIVGVIILYLWVNFRMANKYRTLEPMQKPLRRVGKKIPGAKKIYRQFTYKAEVEALRKILAERDERNKEWAREVRQLRRELDESRSWVYVPNGHFYSPVPNLDQIKKREKFIWKKPVAKIADIDLKEDQQVALLKQLGKYYVDQPWPHRHQANRRFHYLNGSYSYSDGLMLYSMIRHYKPKRLIEIGSGFSSAVTLDTNELFFDNKIACTFIDPYPKLVNSLLKKGDKERNTFIKSNLEDLDPKIFTSLQKNDILFIDSTHVSKTDSDVNYIFFEIFPRLKPGVLIHFHDIFYPFEYPKQWVYQGRGWNEAYMLRAFLENNQDYEIVYFTNFMKTFHAPLLKKLMPMYLNDTGGSIWLRKLA